MNTKKNKKLIFGFAVLAIATIVAFNINANSKERGLADVSLVNVEALARAEGGASCHCTKACDDGNTVASCTGYSYCNCNSGFQQVTCDGVTSSC